MGGSTLARLNKAVVEFTTGRHDPEARAPQERPAQGYRVLSKFLSPAETAAWLYLIDSKNNLFKTLPDFLRDKSYLLLLLEELKHRFQDLSWDSDSLCGL